MTAKTLVLAAVVGTLVGLVSWAFVAWALCLYGCPTVLASCAGGVVGAMNGRAVGYEIADPDCELDLDDLDD